MESTDVDQLINTLAELRLKHWGSLLKNDLNEMNPSEQSLITKYLTKWAITEKAEKRATLIASRVKSARFKRIQTVDNFDFAHSKATATIQKSYLALYNSITSTSLPSAIFVGNAGLGKTHLARALGYAACQKALSTLFITAAEMVNHLSHAQKTFTLELELNRYRRPHVLIIDELGYVSLDAQASNLFFQVISSRHDQGLGTVTTTNIPFGKFNQIFANDAIAHAIVDRLVNDADVFFMEGTSYREHQRAQKNKDKH
jgi:DNA replication protein DnaC